jgi:hypothetical protein
MFDSKILFGALVAVIGIYFIVRKAGGATPPPPTHPAFKVNDIVRVKVGYGAGGWYDTLKIVHYTAGAAPNYGTYDVQMQDGPQNGFYTAFWVAELDAQYIKIG